VNLLAAVAGVAFAALGILGEVAGFNAAAVGLAAGTPATASVPTTVPAPPSTTAASAVDSSVVGAEIGSAITAGAGEPGTVQCPPLEVETAPQYCTLESPVDSTVLPVKLQVGSTVTAWQLEDNGSAPWEHGDIPTPYGQSAATPPVSTPDVRLGTFAGQKPTTIVFGADAGNVVSHLTWTWGATEAVGHGQWGYLSCNPDCASSVPVYYPATITLTDPVGGYFTEISEQTTGPYGSDSGPYSTSLVGGAQ